MGHRQLRQPAEYRRARPSSPDEEIEGENQELFVRYVQLPTPDEIEKDLYYIPTTPAASVEVESIDPRINLREVEAVVGHDIHTPIPRPPETDDATTYLGRVPETELDIEARIQPVPWSPGDVPFTPYMLTMELMDVGTNIAKPREYLEEVEDRIAAPRQALEEVESQTIRIPPTSLEADVGISRPTEADLETEAQSVRSPAVDIEPSSVVSRSPEADAEIDSHIPRSMTEEPIVDAEVSRPPQTSVDVEAAIPSIRSEMHDVPLEIAPVRYTEGLPGPEDFPHGRAVIGDLDVDIRLDQPTTPEEVRIADEDISNFVDLNNTNYVTYQALFDI